MDHKSNRQKNWYALYVNVRHERSVASKLISKGYESYVPVVKKLREWSDRKKQVEVPLISGYVFVKVGREDLDKTCYVPGVVKYVTFQSEPAIVRESEIEGLKFFTTSGYLIDSSEIRDFEIGDKVKFSLSEFSDYHARVENLVGDDYAIIRFDSVSINFRIKAPLKALKKSR